MGDDVQEVEEVAVQVSKETIDEFIKKATTIEWPESVTINVRGVLHRIDEGEALEEIAADHDVSVENLINQVELARQHFAPFADSGAKTKRTSFSLKRQLKMMKKKSKNNLVESECSFCLRFIIRQHPQ